MILLIKFMWLKNYLNYWLKHCFLSVCILDISSSKCTLISKNIYFEIAINILRQWAVKSWLIFNFDVSEFFFFGEFNKNKFGEFNSKKKSFFHSKFHLIILFSFDFLTTKILLKICRNCICFPQNEKSRG